MFTPRSARARKHLPRAPGLSSIVTVNSFAFAMRLHSLPLQDTANRRCDRHLISGVAQAAKLIVDRLRSDARHLCLIIARAPFVTRGEFKVAFAGFGSCGVCFLCGCASSCLEERLWRRW